MVLWRSAIASARAIVTSRLPVKRSLRRSPSPSAGGGLAAGGDEAPAQLQDTSVQAPDMHIGNIWSIAPGVLNIA